MSLVRCVAVATLLLWPGMAVGQAWQSGSALDLVRRAVAHRALRDRDSSLASWHARAHGILRFSALIGDAPDQVERVLRADELRVEVYGAWPARSKQVIVGWRDTSFTPNSLRYHRDHLGIVANDFGGTIRIGDGDEVRDLIHPLSDSGLVHYEFAVGDTTTIASARSTVKVVAVRVRPVDATAAGVVGTLYLDLDRAALVRFLFTFTPESYRDATVENITVTLENSLQQGARWLPWRQAIAIQRGNPLLDISWHTIIRADWQIDDFDLGVTEPASRFTGPALDGLRQPVAGGTWDGALADRLTALPATDADIARAQREASQALQGRSLDGLPAVRFAGHGLSDFLHVNRVQGITLQPGLRVALGREVVARGRVGIGLSDHRVVGEVNLATPIGAARVALGASREMRDVGDEQVISGLGNSLAVLSRHQDFGDYTLVERAGVSVVMRSGRTNLSIEAAREWSTSVAVAFTPLGGSFRSNPALGAGAANVARVGLRRADADGNGWSLHLEGGAGDATWGRVSAGGQGSIAIGKDAIVLRTDVGAATSELPGYRAFVLGGHGSLLGVPDRALGGRRSAKLEVAWAIPVTIGMPRLPRQLQVRPPSTLSLVAAAGTAGGAMAGLPWEGAGRVEPVAGIRLDLWGKLLRLDSGISLRTGHAAVTLDVHPSWWPYF